MKKRSFEADILSKYEKNSSTGTSGGTSVKRADRDFERDIADLRRREYNSREGRNVRTSTFQKQIRGWGYDDSYTEEEERRRKFWESMQQDTQRFKRPAAPVMTDSVYASGKRRFETNHPAKDSQTQRKYQESMSERKKEADRHLRGLLGQNTYGKEREKWQTESDSLEKQIRQGEEHYNSLRAQEFAEKYKQAKQEDNSELLEKKWEAQELRKRADELKKKINSRAGDFGSNSGPAMKELAEVMQKIREIDKEAGSGYMTDEESKAYNMILREEGEAAAEEFEDYIRETLNQREGKEIAENVIKKGNVAKAAFAVTSGLDQFKSGMQQAFTDEELPVSKYQFASAQVRDSIDTAKIGGYDVGQALYDLGTTTFNMVPSIAASWATGGFGGVALGSAVGVGSMSISAKGNAYKQALQEGYSKEQAQNYSTMIGILEGGLQYALGGVGKLGGKASGHAVDAAVRNIESVSGRIAAELGGRMLSEGTEEYLQDILNPVVRNIAFDENNEIKPFTADALYSGILGALSAGLLDGGGVAVSTASEGRIGNEVLKTEGAPESLISTAMEMDTDTEAYRMATKMQEGKLKGTKVNMGRLYGNTMDAVNQNRYRMETQEDAAEQEIDALDGYVRENGPLERSSELDVNTEEIAGEDRTDRQAGEEGIIPNETVVPAETDRSQTVEKAEEIEGVDRSTLKEGHTWNIPARLNSGEDITIKGVEKKNGAAVAVVEIGEGVRTVPVADVWTRDFRVQDVLNKAAEYGRSGAKNLMANYTPEMDAKTYTKGYEAYYNAALVGLPYEKVNSLAASQLSESVLRQAYFAGQNDRAASLERVTVKAKGTGGLIQNEFVSRFSQEQQALLDLYGKASGAGVIVDETIAGGKANGYYDNNGNIHVALDSENPLNVVMNHEMTHYIQQNAPEQYRAYRDFVMQNFKEYYGTSADTLIDQHIDAYERQGVSITKEEAMDELVANASEMFLTDEAAVKKLAKENPSLAEKILDYIKGLVKRIKAMMKDVKPYSQEARMLNENLETAQQAENLWMEALHEAGKVEHKPGETNDEGKGYKKYQINEKFNKEYDAWDKKDGSISFKIGKTSEALKSIGIDEKEILFDSSKIAKIRKYHPEMTDDIIKQVPYILENPVIIMRSRTVDGRITMFGDVKDASGNMVLAALELNPTSRTGAQIEAIKVASAYGKEGNINNFINKSEILYVDQNKKRTINWLSVNRLQLPLPVSQYGSKNIVQQKTQNGKPLLTSNNTSNNKFSLKDLGDSEYVRDSANQQKLTEILEQRLREYRNIEPDRRALEVTTKDILKKYGSKYSKKRLTDELAKLWDYIANSPAVSGEEVMQVTSGIAKNILEDSSKLNRDLTEQYADMRDNIRKTKIKVSDQARAEIENAEGYNNFRKRNMGSLRLSATEGIAIDSYYQELAGLYPEMFDESETPNAGEQLMRISEAMQMTKPFYENPYGMNMEEMQRDLAYELYDTYFNIKPVKTSDARRLNHLQAEYRTRKQELRKEYQKKYEKQIAEIKEKYEKQQGHVAQALAQQRAIYKEARIAREEGKQATKLRQKIKKNGMEISKWLIEPTDKAHVPEMLRKSLLEFLTQIDFTNARAQIDSRSSKSLSEVMMSLNNQLKILEDAQNKEGYAGFEMDIDGDAIAELDRLIEENKGMKSLSELSTAELKQLNDAMTGIKYGLTKANKMIANSRYEDVSECARETIRSLSTKKDIKKEGKANRMLNLDMLDAQSYFQQFGDAGMSVYREIRKGFDKRTWDIKKAQDFILELKKQEGITKKQMNEWTGSRAEGQTFDIDGNQITMTKAQIMSLYLSMLRPQARHHIETGGFRVQETKMKLTGGKKVIGFTNTVKESPVYRLNDVQIAQITDTLTEQEKKFAKSMQEFLAMECADWGNETSMLLYGYRKFNDQNYFPIKTDSNQNRTNDKTVETASLYAIRNQGMTKKTVKNANNAIRIVDVFDVFTKHVTDMANYHGYAVPLSDAMKWFNYTQRNEDGVIEDGVKSQIQRVYGKGGNEYFVKLIQDINGAAYKGEESVYGTGFMGNYKAAAVGANLRVVLQQPTAVARAWAVMDAKYLGHGIWTPAAGKEVTENSAIALWKSWGYYETMIGRSMKEVITGQSNVSDKIKNFAMAPAGLADDLTWGGIWNACRAEIKDTHPELEIGSEEFLQAVADRFDEVIDQTQVVDTTLHRTQFMREKGALAKMQSAFMAEPSKTWNVLRNAYKSGNKGRMAKTAAAYVLTAALTSAAAGIMDAFRDDDEYKKWMEKWIEAMKENMADNVNPLNLFPFVKDAYPYVALGGMTAAEMAASTAGEHDLSEQIGDFKEEYEKGIFASGRMDMEFFEQIQSLCQAVTSGKKNSWEKALSGMALLSMATGIPIKNFARDSEALIGTILGKRLGTSPNENSDRIKMLYDALNGGSEEERRRYREDILENGEDEEYILNSTSKIYTANIKNYLAAGDMESANAEIAGLYKFKKDSGVDDKKIKSSLKSSITAKYKEKVLAGDKQAKEKLKKIKVNGETLYTEEDFARWRKSGEKK